MNKLSELIKQLNNKLECGPDCQRGKESQKLKKNYDDIKYITENSNKVITQARNKYYKYAFGNEKLNAVNKNIYIDQANTILNNFNSNYETNSSNITDLENEINQKKQYIKNLHDLNKSYDKDNTILDSAIIKQDNNTNINNQYIYYETEKIYNLTLANNIIFYLIYFFLIVYLFYFITNKLYYSYKNIFLLLFMYLLGFFLLYKEYFFTIQI